MFSGVAFFAGHFTGCNIVAALVAVFTGHLG
jgi:hypothetical protein